MTYYRIDGWKVSSITLVSILLLFASFFIGIGIPQLAYLPFLITGIFVGYFIGFERSMLKKVKR